MIFKKYSSNAAAGAQSTPEPMKIQNVSGATVTYTIEPAGAVLSALASNQEFITQMVGSSASMAGLQSRTEYATTTNGQGTGLKVGATVTNVGDGTIATFTSATVTSTGSANSTGGIQEFTPTGGSGSGFVVKFRQSIAGAFNPTSVTIVDVGSGYEVGDELTFDVGGLDVVVTLALVNLGLLYNVTSIDTDTADKGVNYKPADSVYFTIAMTVDEVDYTYPVEFRLAQANMADTTLSGIVLASGEISSMFVNKFTVSGTTNRATIAFG